MVSSTAEILAAEWADKMEVMMADSSGKMWAKTLVSLKDCKLVAMWDLKMETRTAA